MTGPMVGPGREHTYGSDEFHGESEPSEDEYAVVHPREPMDTERLMEIAERIRAAANLI